MRLIVDDKLEVVDRKVRRKVDLVWFNLRGVCGAGDGYSNVPLKR